MVQDFLRLLYKGSLSTSGKVDQVLAVRQLMTSLGFDPRSLELTWTGDGLPEAGARQITDETPEGMDAIMSSMPSIPGLNITVGLIYPDKVQHFQEMMASYFHCLMSGTHTDMVLACPQEKKFTRVSC